MVPGGQVRRQVGTGLHLQFYASSVKPGRQRRRQVGFVVMSLATQVQVSGSSLMVAIHTLSQIGAAMSKGTQVQVTGSTLIVAIHAISQSSSHWQRSVFHL